MFDDKPPYEHTEYSNYTVSPVCLPHSTANRGYGTCLFAHAYPPRHLRFNHICDYRNTCPSANDSSTSPLAPAYPFRLSRSFRHNDSEVDSALLRSYMEYKCSGISSCEGWSKSYSHIDRIWFRWRRCWRFLSQARRRLLLVMFVQPCPRSRLTCL